MKSESHHPCEGSPALRFSPFLFTFHEILFAAPKMPPFVYFAPKLPPSLRYKDQFIIITLITFWILPAACENPIREREEKKIDPTKIYYDYRINGDEESGATTVKLQFHAGGPEEKAIRLGDSAKILLDGNPITSDSSKMNGIYYEYSGSNEDFLGHHEIMVRQPGANEERVSFSLPIFTLTTHLDSLIFRRDMELELDGLAKESVVRLSLTDTSYMGNGIERYDTISDGKLSISMDELLRLKDGPIQLEISVNDKQSLKQGGLLTIFYGLRREFYLK